MKNGILFFLLLTTVFRSYGQTPNNWIAETNAPTAVSWSASFSIGYNIYVCSGEDSTGTVNNFYKFNTQTNTWTLLAPFPGSARVNATSFAIGGSGYVGLGDDGAEHGIYGSSGASYSDFYRYDTLTNIWSTSGAIASFPFADTVRNAFGFSINGKGYICLGGANSYSGELFPDIFSTYLYEYDPATNTWSAKSQFPGTARCAATGFVIDSIAYIGTGTNATGSLNDFYAYNPSANNWSASLSAFPGLSRASATGFTICSNGYVGMGEGFNIVSGTPSAYPCADLYQYDPTSNAWALMESYPGISRFGMVFAGINVGDTSFGFAGLGTNNTSPGTNVPNYSELYKYYPPTFCDNTVPTNVPISENENVISIFPNPSENILKVTSDKDILKYELCDCVGKIVKAGTVGEKFFDIVISDTPPNIYYIKLYFIDGNIQFAKCIKD